jgi:hypothetical protein
MPTFVVDQSSRGQTIATSGTLKAIRFMRAPSKTAYAYPGGRLDLVDDSAAGWPPRALWSCDIPSSWFTPPNPTYSHVLLTDGNIAFTNLTVSNVPRGSMFELDVV